MNVNLLLATLMVTGIWALPSYRAYRLIKSATWKVIIGEVTEVGIDEDYNLNLWPRIKYKYRVDGRQYTGKTISISGLISNRSRHDWVREFVKQHPVGAPVKILYNPSRPEESCLRRDGLGDTLLLFLYAAIATYALYKTTIASLFLVLL